jgi:hypothetical protein
MLKIIKFLFIKLNYIFFNKGEKFFKRHRFVWENKSNRTDLILEIIYKKKVTSYLEIGCDDDLNFSKINVQNKIGVDPNKGGNVRLTSDQFFLENKFFFDLIFIDGLHEFKQVIKDIENSIKFLNPNGIILVHDCLPQTIWHQLVPRIYKGTWTGDVWKSIVYFRTKKNLDTYTIFIDNGIGMILPKENKNTLNLNFDQISKLGFKDYYYNYKSYLNVIDYNQASKIIF